ncbi:MAG: Dabb family protein [Planctomycetia bacterium]|nr:Dabb family protein [Planctomycetia bacterium]
MSQVKHCALVKLKKDTPSAVVKDLFDSLAALKGQIPGIIDFSGGAYQSPEGLNKGFTHGFLMTFADEKTRDAYLVHPEHEKVKVKALVLLDGGVDGVIVVDWVA